jgi:hypothetical protein
MVLGELGWMGVLGGGWWKSGCRVLSLLPVFDPQQSGTGALEHR